MKPDKLVHDYTYSFPAIRGIQAGREYYTTMCPLRLIPILFSTNPSDLPPEIRAQRETNKSRILPIAKYIVDNPDDYVFSSITASIDGEVSFQPYGEDQVGRKIGTLSVPMEATFLVNDGQHRRAAIEEALYENPELAHETISVVFFVDTGLKRSQQMFADLNRYAVRPTKSLGILYDHRDPLARLVNQMIKEIPIFNGMTETAKSSISNRSRKLFTLSSLYQATKKFLGYKDNQEISEDEKKLSFNFWMAVTQNMPDWRDAADRKVAPSELRRDYIHAHGIALQALAIAGNSLVKERPDTWKNDLEKIKKIDWMRANTKLWEGRALIGGSLNKSQKNVLLTANIIKKNLGLSLNPKEEAVEEVYVQSKLS